MATEQHPAESILKGHYASPGIKESIKEGLEMMGKTIDSVTPSELKMMDEFHMGGAPAAMFVLQSMNFTELDTVLDVGCGVGGTTRALAANFAVARIEGVDLTPEYVDIGNEINGWPLVRASFKGGVAPILTQGSALALPFPDASFSKIVMLHVGMNIQDKSKLFQAFKRVLKPGGTVGVFDLMRTSEGDLPFPMPWSSSKDTSFVQTPEVYKQAMSEAGLTVLTEENRKDALMEMLAKQLQAGSNAGPENPLTLRILMGETMPVKGQNAMSMVKSGIIAPILITSSL